MKEERRKESRSEISDSTRSCLLSASRRAGEDTLTRSFSPGIMRLENRVVERRVAFTRSRTSARCIRHSCYTRGDITARERLQLHADRNGFFGGERRKSASRPHASRRILDRRLSRESVATSSKRMGGGARGGEGGKKEKKKNVIRTRRTRRRVPTPIVPRSNRIF